jgi:Cu2+-containing amine oxidase
VLKASGQQTLLDAMPLSLALMMTVPVQVDGNLVTWQKWRLRIGFNFKEASVPV